jgi:hypothetical protein
MGNSTGTNKLVGTGFWLGKSNTGQGLLGGPSNRHLSSYSIPGVGSNRSTLILPLYNSRALILQDNTLFYVSFGWPTQTPNVQCFCLLDSCFFLRTSCLAVLGNFADIHNTYFLIILYDRLLLVTQIPCSIYNLFCCFHHWLHLIFSFVAHAKLFEICFWTIFITFLYLCISLIESFLCLALVFRR